jgi:integrase/recombinase XerC
MDATPATPLVRSSERHLRAANRAPTTVATYLHAVRQAHGFLHDRGTTLEAATRADLEAFMADLLARRAPATAATYHKVLKILYAWLVEEGEAPADPTLRMRPPIVPDAPVPIVPDDGLKRLFQACAGNSFEARRDTALLMLLLDTGARREEMVGLTLNDVDLDLDVLVVLGKGRRERSLPFGRKCSLLDAGRWSPNHAATAQEALVLRQPGRPDGTAALPGRPRHHGVGPHAHAAVARQPR